MDDVRFDEVNAGQCEKTVSQPNAKPRPAKGDAIDAQFTVSFEIGA